MTSYLEQEIAFWRGRAETAERRLKEAADLPYADHPDYREEWRP